MEGRCVKFKYQNILLWNVTHIRMFIYIYLNVMKEDKKYVPYQKASYTENVRYSLNLRQAVT